MLLLLLRPSRERRSSEAFSKKGGRSLKKNGKNRSSFSLFGDSLFVFFD